MSTKNSRDHYLSELCIELEELLARKQNERILLGICGAPAAGKSTLASLLCSQWCKRNGSTAIVVPMDGYHHDNSVLEAMGILDLKGIPDSFRAEDFITKFKEIKADSAAKHYCPMFDRQSESSIANAIEVNASHKLIITEGNYLLLAKEPWRGLRDLLDRIWYIQANEDLIFPRLLARHKKGGKNQEASRQKVLSTDIPNARLVMQQQANADKIIAAEQLIGSRKQEPCS